MARAVICSDVKQVKALSHEHSKVLHDYWAVPPSSPTGSEPQIEWGTVQTHNKRACPNGQTRNKTGGWTELWNWLATAPQEIDSRATNHSKGRSLQALHRFAQLQASRHFKTRLIAWGNMSLGHKESRQMCQEPPLHSSQLNSCFLWQTRTKRASPVDGDII